MIFKSQTYIIITLYFISSIIYADNFDDQRGMTKLLGIETYKRCAQQMSDPNAKVYELSYERTSSMPLSPFAGEYKPKFLPEIPWAGSRQVFTMDVLNEDVNDGNQGTQMDALGHFGYTEEVWDGNGEADLSSLKYFGDFHGKEVKPKPDSPLNKLGIETVPPIITTAVFLDVRKHIFDGRAMKAGEYVTVEHIKETISKTKLKDRGILPGDVVTLEMSPYDLTRARIVYRKK